MKLQSPPSPKRSTYHSKRFWVFISHLSKVCFYLRGIWVTQSSTPLPCGVMKRVQDYYLGDPDSSVTTMKLNWLSLVTNTGFE